MHEDASVTARSGGRDALGAALRSSRADTLATFAVYERALPGLQVPQRAELNPPLWELGHLGWFQEYWIARNPQRARGWRADPQVARSAGVRANADALYDSSHVPHDSRWSLPLPDADDTRHDLAQQFEATAALLAEGADDATGLYFHRLALLHEDTHHEAALYMAQALGVAIDDQRWQAQPLPEPGPALQLPPGRWGLGSDIEAAFAFDNELGAHEVDLPATTIDRQAVRWAEYLPFVEAGGAPAPRYLRRDGSAWLHWRHGRWQALDQRLAACHLTQHEAQGWCRWARRRLPTEAEWERAALTHPAAFRWGDVWEWTSSTFAPYPGFEPHPYREYSQPWFDGRPVLRGASFMTQPRMRCARYRNYFPPSRSDVAAGFRSCAL
jgi:iron(II)-dependent oxidoreductase